LTGLSLEAWPFIGLFFFHGRFACFTLTAVYPAAASPQQQNSNSSRGGARAAAPRHKTTKALFDRVVTLLCEMKEKLCPAAAHTQSEKRSCFPPPIPLTFVLLLRFLLQTTTWFFCFSRATHFENYPNIRQVIWGAESARSAYSNQLTEAEQHYY